MDDDGEYHLYPITDGKWEAQYKLNEYFGLALQAFALFISGLCKIQVLGAKSPSFNFPHLKEIQKCDPPPEGELKIIPSMTEKKHGNLKSNSSSQNRMKVKYSRRNLEKDNSKDLDVSDEEPIVYNTPINESVIPRVVSENRESKNRKFSHTRNREPEPRHPKDASRREKIICHAETREVVISTEEHGITKDLKPMTGSPKRVVEPVALVRAGTSVVQTAELIIVCLDPCDSGINSESEVGSSTEDLKNELVETAILAPQNPSIMNSGPGKISVSSKRARKIRISKKESPTGARG